MKSLIKPHNKAILMGNYKDIEHDFIDRTMKLIAQYESILYRYPFEQQYNYTLLLNCLLGIIVIPKETVFSHIPNPAITSELLEKMGLVNSSINKSHKNFRDLISNLRNSIAHGSFKIVSNTDDFLVDEIVFTRTNDGQEVQVANFESKELLPFLRYYADWIKSNLIEHR